MKKLFGLLHKRVCVRPKEMQWHIMSKSMLYNCRWTSSALLISLDCVPVSCARARHFLLHSCATLSASSALIPLILPPPTTSAITVVSGATQHKGKRKYTRKILFNFMLIILVDFSRLDRFFILDETLQIFFFVLHNVVLYFVRVDLLTDIIFILIF